MFSDNAAKRLGQLIEQHRNGIFDIADTIWKTPETGLIGFLTLCPGLSVPGAQALSCMSSYAVFQ